MHVYLIKFGLVGFETGKVHVVATSLTEAHDVFTEKFPNLRANHIEKLEATHYTIVSNNTK